MKILVMGGSGYIGVHLCNYLNNMGYEVVSFSKKRSNLLHRKIRQVQGNFSDVRSYESELENVDCLFHLISTTNPRSSEGFEKGLSDNVISSISLFQSAVSKRVKKCIFLSSGGTIYGEIEDKQPACENHLTNPISQYGIEKLFVEKYLSFFGHAKGLKYNIVRLSNPFGTDYAGLDHYGVIPTFNSLCQTNSELEIWGDGNEMRDYIHITDVVRALEKLINYNGEIKIFNLSSGIGRSLNEIVKSIIRISNCKSKVKYVAAKNGTVDYNVLSNKLISKEINWFCKKDFCEGLKDYCEER